MAKAYLVTHPETRLDHQGRIHGNLDPPLSYSGKIKGKLLARSFKGKKISKIHSSPRQRALEMAKMISDATGAPVEVHADLLPWDLGSLSGSKVGAMRPLLDFFSSRPDRPAPGGEPKSAVLMRWTKFLKGLKAGEVVAGHSQHSLSLDHARRGGDASKVPMVGGKAGEVRSIEV